jgi:hypothetical protein
MRKALPDDAMAAKRKDRPAAIRVVILVGTIRQPRTKNGFGP